MEDIKDGNSQVPNKKGKKNCDREGFPGHWIIKLRSGFPPKTYNGNGSEVMPPESFKPGNYAQVNVSVAGNTGDSPGVYINPVMAALGPATVPRSRPDPTLPKPASVRASHCPLVRPLCRSVALHRPPQQHRTLRRVWPLPRLPTPRPLVLLQHRTRPLVRRLRTLLAP